VRLPVAIIVLNVLGFFFGPLGRLIPKAIEGQGLFLPIPILTVFYNVVIGFTSSLTIILVHNILLAGAKRVLDVTRLDELNDSAGRRIHDLSLRLKNVLYPFGLALLFGAIMGVAGFSIYSREIRAVTAASAASAVPEAAALLQKEWAFLLSTGILYLILLAVTLGLSLFFSGRPRRT